MTKKHTYALYTVVPIGGEWKRLEHFMRAIVFDYYESNEEAIDDLRKQATYNLFHEICGEGHPFLPVDFRSQSYMIYDETSDKIVSVFTLEVRLKEENP